MLSKKPLNRLMPEDWHRNLESLRRASKESRDASFELRQETSYLRNELTNKFTWDARDNTTRLDDRVYEVRRVENDLKLSLRLTNEEIKLLQSAKDVTEREIENHLVPIEVAMECLMLRERRREGDLIRDYVEEELEKEIKLLERSRADLEKLCLQSIEQLRTLNGSRQRLESDLKDKDKAIKIDDHQASLTESSPDISFKPDAMAIQKESLTPMEWLKHSTDNIKDADFSIRKSQNLRDEICITIQRTIREDAAQTRLTDFTLRRRLHQETRARDELQWEKDKLLQEIELQEHEIADLDERLKFSALPLKVSQTRLENRKWRPGKDLVEDCAQSDLRAEVLQLHKSRDLLRENINLAKQSLHSLQNKLQLVDADLTRKSLSVTLEKKCQDSRLKLIKELQNSSETEKNMTLTGTLRMHPTKILY